VCAALVLGFAGEASADQYGTGTFLVWPEADAEGTPTNAQVWLVSSYDEEPSFVLRSADGVVVPADEERIDQAYYGDGPFVRYTVLTPRDALAPNTTYTVEVTTPDESHPYHRNDVLSFTTGQGPLDRAPEEVAEVTFVAFEGLDLGLTGCCVDDSADTLYGVTWPRTSGAVLHRGVLTLERPGEEPRRQIWIGKEGWGAGGDDARLTDRAKGDTEYPCMTFELTDVFGRTVAEASRCAPEMCIQPSVVPDSGVPWWDYLDDTARWTPDEERCRLAPEQPLSRRDEDEGAASGCATAPASPVRTPWLLALAWVCGLGARRVRRRR
jgi:MYXO-CTERM domain-containing protein